MTRLLTADQIRTHVETDMVDTAVNRLIDDAESEMVRLYGPHVDDITEIHTPGPGQKYLFTKRPIDEVTSVTELTTTYAGETDLVLDDADDYVLEGKTQLRRLGTGTNPSTMWAAHVTVEYTPVDDTTRRERVLIDLVKLAVRFEGVQASSGAGVSITHVDYDAQRSCILARLGSLSGSFA